MLDVVTSCSVVTLRLVIELRRVIQLMCYGYRNASLRLNCGIATSVTLPDVVSQPAE